MLYRGIVGLFVVFGIAVLALYAQEPPDQAGLAIDQGGSTPHSGHYAMRLQCPVGNATFVVVGGQKRPDPLPDPAPSRTQWPWSVPPEATDNMAGNAMVAYPVPAKVGGYGYGMLRGTTPGWVQVRFFCNGGFVVNAFYRFYEVYLLHDDQAAPTNKAGLDVRYGSDTSGEFPELGGPYSMSNLPEVKAEDLMGFYDGSGNLWTGSGGMPRDPVYMPEIALAPLGVVPQQRNSHVANLRKPEVVRLYVHGPRDGALMPAVPIYLHMTNRANGNIIPGPGIPMATYDVKCSFRPHDANPWQDGSWAWPTNTTPPSGPPAPPALKRLNMVDQAHFTPLDEGMRWMLRIPWVGDQPSSYYGDIELEVQVPNLAWTWTSWGSPQGPHEGVMHTGFDATVVELERLDMHIEEPDDLDRLKSEWVRRFEYELHGQGDDPATKVGTPDMVTIGFGAHVCTGERQNDLASMQVLKDWLDQTLPRWADAYLTPCDAMINCVNQKLDTQSDPPYTHWIVAQNPSDVGEPWVTVPASIEVDFRGYIGTIESRATNAFLAEPSEPDAGATTATTWQHFINVVADVNNDGYVDAKDDDDNLESNGALLVTPDEGANEPLIPAAVDPNLERIEVRFSQAASGAYDGHEVWIEAASGAETSKMVLWEENTRQTKIDIELIDPDAQPPLYGWKIPIPSDGSDVVIWAGNHASSPVPADKLRFYIAAPAEGQTAKQRIAMDYIVVAALNVTLDSVEFVSDFQAGGSSLLRKSPEDDDAPNRFRYVGDPYEKPEWVRDGRNNPIAHKKSTCVQLKVKLTVKPAGLEYVLVGEGDHPYMDFESATRTATGTTETIELTATSSLPNKCQHLTETIVWKVRVAGVLSSQEPEVAKSGQHSVFVTYDTPRAANSYNSPNALTVRRLALVVEVADQESDVDAIAEAMQLWRDSLGMGDSTIPPDMPADRIWAMVDRTEDGACAEGSVLMEQAMRLLGIDAEHQHVRASKALPVLVHTAASPQGLLSRTDECGDEKLLMWFGAASGWQEGEGCCLVNSKLYAAYAYQIVGVSGGQVGGVTAQSAAHHILLQLKSKYRPTSPLQYWAYQEANGDWTPCDSEDWEPVP